MTNRTHKRWAPRAICAAVMACAALITGVANAEPELLAFTYRSPGVCAPCDRARPILIRMRIDYPIQYYYVEEPTHQSFAKQWRVDRYPTFIFVDKIGAHMHELARWSGSERLEERIRALFAQFQSQARVRPGAPSGPRPIVPEVKPPKPRPHLPPTPPRKTPPKPRTPQKQGPKPTRV